MPQHNLLFADLIKLPQQGYHYEDISPERWDELKPVAALLTYKVFAADPHATPPTRIIEDCRRMSSRE